MARVNWVRALVVGLSFVATGAVHSAQAQNWASSGLMKFGVFLQGSLIEHEVHQAPVTTAPFRQTATPNGVGVGVSWGYDLRMGRWLVGIEIDGAFDNGRDKIDGGTGERFGAQYTASVRGRLGLLFHQAMLFYGTVGYGLAGAEYQVDGRSLPSNLGISDKKSVSLGGVTFGGGVEYDIGWSILFAEYLHTEYNRWSFRNRVASKLNVDTRADVARLGLKFKIGHDYAHDTYRVPGSFK